MTALARQHAGLRGRFPTRAERADKAHRCAEARAWRARMRPFFDALYGPEVRDRTGGYHGSATERARGLAFAARWRREQPHKAMLDAIYGAEA